MRPARPTGVGRIHIHQTAETAAGPECPTNPRIRREIGFVFGKIGVFVGDFLELRFFRKIKSVGERTVFLTDPVDDGVDFFVEHKRVHEVHSHYCTTEMVLFFHQPEKELRCLREPV